MTELDETIQAPDGVLSVVRQAVTRDLLADVESLAAGIAGAGWVRATEPGLWRYPADPAWIIVSSDHAPNLSIFASGPDDAVLGTASRVRTQLDAGAAGELRQTVEDADWSIWTGGEVVVSLNATTSRRHGSLSIPASMQLAIERSDTPSEGMQADPERARHLALTGSPIQRWYLAAEYELPDDVIAILRNDEDPAVAAAIRARQTRRDRPR